jgi:hypothetical protein
MIVLKQSLLLCSAAWNISKDSATKFSYTLVPLTTTLVGFLLPANRIHFTGGFARLGGNPTLMRVKPRIGLVLGFLAIGGVVTPVTNAAQWRPFTNRD